MTARTVSRLSREDIYSHLESICSSAGKFTSAQIDEMLLEFCLNCPDPVAAMDAVVEAPQDSTSEWLLDKVMEMPLRSPLSYSESELAPTHPFRHWRVRLHAV